MKKLLVLSTIIALLSGLTAQAVTIQENTTFPNVDIIAGQSQLAQDGTQIMRNEDASFVAVGQSFTLYGAETLQAITIQMGVGRNKTLDTDDPHEFELWIGSYDDTTVSNHVAGATNLLTAIDVAGLTFSDGNYYTLNLDAPLALPAGDYAFQLYYTTALQGDHRIWWAKNSDGGYAGGELLVEAAMTGQLPFEEVSTDVDDDLVFALHSASVGPQATLFANPDSLDLVQEFVSGSTTGTVDFSYTGAAMNITNITIGSESHPGSFSHLASFPVELILPAPTNYPVEFVFTNVSNLNFLASATAVATIDWEIDGGGGGGQVIVPLSATVGERIYGKFITVDDLPVFNLTPYTNTVAESTQRLRNTGSLTTSAGQTFTIPEGSTTTVSRLGVFVNTTENYDTDSTHEIKLWLGEYTNDTPGATYAFELFDMAGASFGSTHLTFDLSSDATLPPGDYAFQLAWTTADAAHDISLRRTTNSNYAAGSRLNSASSELPFTAASEPGSGLRFEIHSRTEAEWVDMGTVFPTGDDIVASMNATINSNDVTLVRSDTVLKTRSSGQSFDLAEATTLSAITIQSADFVNFNAAAKHELDLWIVELDNGLSNAVPLWVDAVSLSSQTITNDNFYKIDFTDITLPAGSYGIQVEWAKENSNHELSWRKSDGDVDEYADGYLLHDIGWGLTAPFDGTASSVDLVFALHKLEAGFSTWIAGFGLSGGDADPDFDKDGDGLVNIVEYGLGGDPTDPLDVGTTPLTGSVEDSGMNYFEYIHVKRTDDLTLTYELEQDSNLVSAPGFTNDIPGLIETSGSTEDPDFDAVTNRIPTAGKTQEFIRLIIE